MSTCAPTEAEKDILVDPLVEMCSKVLVEDFVWSVFGCLVVKDMRTAPWQLSFQLLQAIPVHFEDDRTSGNCVSELSIRLCR